MAKKTSRTHKEHNITVLTIEPAGASGMFMSEAVVHGPYVRALSKVSESFHAMEGTEDVSIRKALEQAIAWIDECEIAEPKRP